MLRKQNQGPASREARIAAFNSRPIKPDSNLHKAVKNFEIDVVKQLLANGANVNAKAEHGVTPLNDAVTFEKDQLAKAKEIVELLLAKGAKINAKDDFKQTPLHSVCQFGAHTEVIAAILIANGAKVNIKDENGVTPLSFAAMKGDIELIELLIKAGANVNSKDRDGTTVLGWGEENPEVVKLLLKHGAK